MRRAASLRRLACLLAACGLPLAAPAPAGLADDMERANDAERAEDAELAREAVGQGSFVAVDTLLDWIEARYFGSVIEVELEEEDEDGEPPTYEIEWLTPRQHVIEFEFDARTGDLIEIEGHGLEDARRP